MENLRTLVLNGSYEPLQFTAARRALVLVLLGKAEALESDGFCARTPTTVFRLPTVIKLNRYVRRPVKAGVAFSKKNVLKRDGHVCQYCGERGGDLTIDHVIPRSMGGASTWENVVTACRGCNLRKGNKTIAESGLRLKRKPVKPKFLIFSSVPENPPRSHLESWSKYLPGARV
ncbi:MAG: HNH endonuclease [Candidatus Nitrospinota bacterium M3_3B_026]